MIENQTKATDNTTTGHDIFSNGFLKFETNTYNQPDRGKLVDTLNALIEINNDRIAGYEYAKKETKEPELKTLFNQFISTSTKCKEQLVHEIQELGAIPTSGAHQEGPFFKAWMDLEVLLTCEATCLCKKAHHT